MLSDINMKKGESECQYYIDKLEYLDDRQRDARIEQCKSLLCHGELRSKSGTVREQHCSTAATLAALSLVNTSLTSHIRQSGCNCVLGFYQIYCKQ